jgi:GT2 family glycosyltransferase
MMQVHMEETPGTPRVTALVVSRDNEAALRSCLTALEASDERERLEVLVVDDGSTDNSAAVIDDFPAAVSLVMPKRLGWTRAVNIGLRTAKGVYVFLLDAGVRVAPDTIRRLACALDERDEAGAVCPYVDRTYRFPDAAALATAWKTGEMPGAVAVEPNSGEVSADYPKGAPIMVRKELLRAMNYLDVRFGHSWSDLEMCWRIRSGGKKVLVLTDVLVDRTPVAERRTELDQIDSAAGAATWIGLHGSFLQGLNFRLAAAFGALFSGHMSGFTGILAGQKIDGNQ